MFVGYPRPTLLLLFICVFKYEYSLQSVVLSLIYCDFLCKVAEVVLRSCESYAAKLSKLPKLRKLRRLVGSFVQVTRSGQMRVRYGI